MKTFISLILIASVSVGAFFALQGKEKEICFEDWYANTSQLFKSASSLFSGLGSSSDEIEEIDAKLKELLPAETLDLSYQASSDQTLLSALPAEQKGLLPNLFKERQQAGTQIKGQVHTDDEDNIVGAEVNVSIPTDIR